MSKLHPAIVEERATHKTPDEFVTHKDDVWGAFDTNDGFKQVKKGLIVARMDDICPIFADKIPYKSVTVVFDPNEFPEDEVDYWLGYVHGGENIAGRADLKDGKIALRSNYTAW